MAPLRASWYDSAILIAKKAFKIAEHNAGKNYPDVALSLEDLASHEKEC